jgi:hypothetical protein
MDVPAKAESPMTTRLGGNWTVWSANKDEQPAKARRRIEIRVDLAEKDTLLSIGQSSNADRSIVAT